MCANCHECGTKLRLVLDGEEWCDYCQTYRRYNSHGWSSGEVSPCLPHDVIRMMDYTRSLFDDRHLPETISGEILEGYRNTEEAREDLRPGFVRFTARGYQFDGNSLTWAIKTKEANNVV